jgi:hypothetical protein
MVLEQNYLGSSRFLWFTEFITGESVSWKTFCGGREI